MAIRKTKDRSRLDSAIRNNYEGGTIDPATVAWLKSLDPQDIIWARLEAARELLTDLIEKSTARKLYPGDRSIIPMIVLREEVIGARLAVDVIDEIGTRSGAELLRELADMVECT